MINKKIQEDFIKQRDERQQEPEVQVKLRAAMLSAFNSSIELLPRQAWEFGLTFGVKRENALGVFKRLRDDKEFSFNMLVDVTAVDWAAPREARFDVGDQLFGVP